MTKKKRSEQVSTDRQKRAKAQPENPLPSPGPSRIDHQPGLPLPVEDVAMEGFATTESVARIEGDRRETNPRPGPPSPELLSAMTHELRFVTGNEDNTAILYLVYNNLQKVREDLSAPGSLVSLEVFLRNASLKQASDFLGLAKQAARKKDWKDVILHDVFWTKLPDPSPRFSLDPDMIVPEESSQRGKSQILRRGSAPTNRFGYLAAELSWNASFVDQAVLKALESHISQQMDQEHTYARFCSIVQSSGMGKSRLLDEFSKSHFLIPINLRPEGTKGFPPPDIAVRNFLTQYDQKDPEIQRRSYSRASHFLLSLFDHTKDTIVALSADNKEDRIAKFREFMSNGQTFASAGKNRRNFYADIVRQAQKDIDDHAETPSDDKLRDAFERLQECVCDRTPLEGERSMADVFITFDEAHPLTDHWDETSGLSNYIELRRALQVFSESSLFTFFLSTTGNISQISPPRTHDPSNRVYQGEFKPPHPFIELGFDQLMWNRKVLEKYKSLEEITSSECIAHMGRPLWGTMYDLGDERVRRRLLYFAIEKLLHGSTISALTEDQQYAVLSQRLALDIHTTAYVEAPPNDASEKILKQIANHMRVCVEIRDGMETIRGIAASEPILSEAASYIMRQNSSNFDLAESLSKVLSGFSVHLGDRGELLVAAFFTWARDKVFVEHPPPPLPEFCRHFSVEELFSCLFFGPIFQSLLDDTPSIGPSKAEKQTFGEVTRDAHLHFSHFIQAQEKKFVSHQYLLAVMARGAAVLGATGQAGVDMVFPYLYGSTVLDDKNIGFIMVQVKNDSKFSVPDADLFQKWIPSNAACLTNQIVMSGLSPSPSFGSFLRSAGIRLWSLT
ncbi:hypothetical protein BJV78DRAFT_1279535 [Lactifluus subvellereus]|nr:hypothetical protein BJV78DRAFT_1279535 [Lactifluus subvellereus]